MLMASFTATPYIFQSRLTYAKYFKQFLQHSKLKSTTMTSSPKPLNILIYGQEKPTDCDLIQKIKNSIQPGRFTVYSITKKSFLLHPWMETAKLLVIARQNESSNDRPFKECDIITKYISNGGKILDFSTNYLQSYGLSIKDPNFNAFTFENNSSFSYSLDNNKQKVVCSYKSSGGVAIVCSMSMLSVTNHLHNFLLQLDFTNDELRSEAGCEIPSSTPYLVFAESKIAQEKFLNSLITAKPKNVELLSAENFSQKVMKTAENDNHVIIYSGQLNDYQRNDAIQPYQFNWDLYNRNLSTSSFGKVVLYADVTSSTMDVLSNVITSDPGAVAIVANQQTSGKGRGGNKWLSPIGCAMFTMCFSIPIRSPIGRNISITQHMMALALVQAIRSIKGLEDLNLKIKWPNDIYIGEKHKIGGILTKSSIYSDKVFLYIGLGVNLSNEQPTKCINQLIKDQYPSHPPITNEELIAATISQLELIIIQYQLHGGKSFLQQYHEHWMHSGKEVTVDISTNRKQCKEEGTIIGIDEAGFLQVRLKSHSQDVSMQPDGNTFDITRNLIMTKPIMK